MLSVQEAPAAGLALPAKGAPPEREVPSSHESVQLTSVGYEPPLTVIGMPPAGGGDAAGAAAKKVNDAAEPLANV